MPKHTTLKKQRVAEISPVQVDTFRDVKTKMWALQYDAVDIGEVVFPDIGDANAEKVVPEGFRDQVTRSRYRIVVCPKSRIGGQDEGKLIKQGFTEMDPTGDFLCMKNE